jgi:hypothetical protein
MKPNVGEAEAYLRIGAGLTALALIPFTRSRWGTALLGMVAASGLETGISHYCPMSELLGIDNAPGRANTPLRNLFHREAA